MDRRRLQGQMAGTARTGKHEVEVVAEMAFEVDGGTTRIRVGPAGAPERSEVREVQDPAVARWVEKFHFDVERMARAEAHRRRPCVPNWKPPRTARPARGAMVCPDCDGVGEFAGAACAACDGQGWRPA